MLLIFTIRADDFDADLIVKGESAIKAKWMNLEPWVRYRDERKRTSYSFRVIL